MFITFRSDAYEDITYFNDVGKKLLALMGHSATVPGALTSDQVPDALNSLQRGLELEKSNLPPAKLDDDEGESEISLAKRAVPLVSLLQAAIRKDCDVLWESSKSPGV